MPRSFSPGPLVCVAAFVAAAFTVPSFADETNYDRTTRNEVRREVLRYSDLNLNTEYGADQLLRRIEIAAGHVCGDRMGPRALDEHRFERNCSNIAEEVAVYDVGHPLVIARYYGRTPDIVIDDQYSYYREGSVDVNPYGKSS